MVKIYVILNSLFYFDLVWFIESLEQFLFKKRIQYKKKKKKTTNNKRIQYKKKKKNSK
jgi:hypothetical protein